MQQRHLSNNNIKIINKLITQYFALYLSLRIKQLLIKKELKIKQRIIKEELKIKQRKIKKER